MAIPERDTVYGTDSNRTVYTRESSGTGWFVGIIVALALLAIGYLVFSANSGPATSVDVNTTPAVQAPATDTMTTTPMAPAETAPAATTEMAPATTTEMAPAETTPAAPVEAAPADAAPAQTTPAQ